MTKEWRIRIATIQDASGLHECMEHAYAPYLERLGGKRLPPMEVDYASEIENFPTWIIDSDGAVVGGLIMALEKNYAVIANISVHPKVQGQGLGGKLMKYAESIASQKGYSELRLTTHILLTENLSLYGHLGWSEISRDESRVYMKKDIGNKQCSAG